MKVDSRGGGGERKVIIWYIHCLWNEKVGRINITKIKTMGYVNLFFADIMLIVGSLQCAALILHPGEEKLDSWDRLSTPTSMRR